MGSLTIRLDDETDHLLDHFAQVLNQNKSAVARAGILDYLQRQQQLEAQKLELEKSINVSSIEEVQQRVAESESSYRLSDEEYEQSMNEFFARELGLVR
mgnify:CR=1 FL=1